MLKLSSINNNILFNPLLHEQLKIYSGNKKLSPYVTMMFMEFEYTFESVIEKWKQQKQGEPSFIRYIMPPIKVSKNYNKGESWFEKLLITSDIFQSCFNYIGITYKSRTEYKKAMRKNIIFKKADNDFFKDKGRY